MTPRLLVLLLAFSCALGARGEDSGSVWRADGKPVPDADNRKSKEGFGAELFMTTNAQFFTDWKKPVPPVLNPSAKVQRNVAIDTVLIIVDPGLDKSGAANVTCDMTVRKPDGGVYQEQKDVPCWVGKYDSRPHILELAQSGMRVRIDPGDPLGVYTVEVLVKDHNKNVELPLKTTFEATETNYEQWLTYYYQSKDPTAFPGFLDDVKKQVFLSNENSGPPVSAFIGTLLHDHPELIAKYFGDISAFPENEQKSVALILQISNTKEGRAILKKSRFKAAADRPPVNIPGMEVTGPGDLDVCWGYFFASGDTNGLAPIVAALAFAKYTGAMDAYKAGSNTPADQKKALLEATWRAAMWSLQSNATQHPLVMQYIEDQLRAGKLPKDVMSCLALIMAQLKPDQYKVNVQK